MSKKVLLYSKLCELDELTCLVCAVDENEKRDKSAPSIFHHKILKCRLLIFSASEILASPDYKSDFKIFVIFNRKITDGVKFWEHIHKINLKIIKTDPVDLSTYEACLKYTLIAKIAPLWNHVQTNILIKGRDFLYNSTPSEAVQFNVFVFENAVVMEIECIKIRLNLIRIKDLDITQKKMDYLNDVPDSSIQEQFMLDQWIQVLPSLKKGRVVSVNRTIPKSSLFDNYKDLKRHWKNCYGYRLPDEDLGIVYYEVHFGPLGPQLYTYPSICLLSNYPIKVSPAPQSINEIAESFQKDVNKTISHILGHCANFDKLDLEYVNDLADYSPLDTVQVLKMNKILCDNRINHKNSSMTVEQDEVSYEEMESIKLILLKNENTNLEENELISPENSADDESIFSQKMSLCTPVQSSVNEESLFSQKLSLCTPVQSSGNGESLFSQKLSLSIPVQNSGNGEKYKPTFIPKIKKDILSNDNLVETKISYTNDKPNYLCDIKIENNSKFKPTFLPKTVFNGDNRKRNIDSVAIEKNQQNAKNDTPLSQIIKSEYNKPGFKSETSKIQKLSVDSIDKAHSKNITLTGNFGICTLNNTESTGKQNLSSLHLLQQHNAPKKVVTSVPKVIKENLTDACITIDIPSMARTNFESLKKLTVRTLLLWLRSQNVHVTTKMVKQQLLDKIREHLNL